MLPSRAETGMGLPPRSLGVFATDTVVHRRVGWWAPDDRLRPNGPSGLQFTNLTEAEVRQLHGMGPNAIDLIRLALAAKGLTFSNSTGTRRSDAPRSSNTQHQVK